MTTRQVLNLLVLGGVLAFNFLFWGEKMGVNSLLFTSLMLGILYYLYPKSWRERSVQIVALGTFLSAIMVMWHNSFIAAFVHNISFICLAGLINQKGLRHIGYGLLGGLMSIATVPIKLVREITGKASFSQRVSRAFRYFKLAIIPFFIVLVFLQIYRSANAEFDKLAAQLLTPIYHLFTFDIPFERIFFFGLATFIVGGLLWRNRNTYMSERQAEQSENLERKRPERNTNQTSENPLALKNEYRMGLMTLIALNAMLLLVNWTDIRHIWFGFDAENPGNLKFYVHEGTYFLIIAILLAMLVLIWFFRKNLNFYPNNKHLKAVSYIWIAQNVFLAFSVALRNYRYIDFHGLAYRRIGVIIFLLLTFYGLYTMYIKVKSRKSLYYLLEKNGWACYFIFISLTFVSWDTVITKYNLFTDTRSNIDVRFLVKNVSDKNLYLLEENMDILKSKPTYPAFSEKQIADGITNKRARYERKQKQYSWKSWNWADMRNK